MFVLGHIMEEDEEKDEEDEEAAGKRSSRTLRFSEPFMSGLHYP